MATFMSLPNETIIQILKSCDSLSDVVALASSCKKFQAVYASNVHAIGSRVGRRAIPAFEDAVITSRATRIVIEHFDQGRFPPTPFPLDSLPISAQKLSLQDVNYLMDWSHYITCLEDICLRKTRWGQYLPGVQFRSTPREAQDQRSTALYPTAAIPDDSLDRTHASAVYAAVLQCLFSTLVFWDHRVAAITYVDRKTKKHTGRTVKVVPLGSFYPEQISTPAHAHDAHNIRLVGRTIPPARKGNTVWKKHASHLRLILQDMQHHSGQPNVYDDDCPTPMPPLQVFQFIARKFLGLRIAEDASQVEGGSAAHERLVLDPGMATVYMDDWPLEAPVFFDPVDDAGNWQAFYLGDDDE